MLGILQICWAYLSLFYRWNKHVIRVVSGFPKRRIKSCKYQYQQDVHHLLNLLVNFASKYQTLVSLNCNFPYRCLMPNCNGDYWPKLEIYKFAAWAIFSALLQRTQHIYKFYFSGINHVDTILNIADSRKVKVKVKGWAGVKLDPHYVSVFHMTFLLIVPHLYKLHKDM